MKETHLLILKQRSEGQQPAGLLSGAGGWWAPSSRPPVALLQSAGTIFFFFFSQRVTSLCSPLLPTVCQYLPEGSFYARLGGPVRTSPDPVFATAAQETPLELRALLGGSPALVAPTELEARETDLGSRPSPSGHSTNSN